MSGHRTTNSSSASATTTTNLDKRQVVDGGAIGISADNSDVGLTLNTTTNYTTSDWGAIQSAAGSIANALDVVRSSNAGALDVVRSSNASALDVVKASDANGSRNLDNILNLAGSIFDSTIDVVSGAGLQLSKAYENANNAVTGAYANAQAARDNPDLKTINTAALAVVGIVAAIAFTSKRST